MLTLRIAGRGARGWGAGRGARGLSRRSLGEGGGLGTGAEAFERRRGRRVSVVGCMPVQPLFQRLFGRRLRRRPVVCYLRENGPIAYELDLFSSGARERADAMMSGEIFWAWKGADREWTELTRVSLSAFLADLAAGDVLLVGTETDVPVNLSDRIIKDWIRGFCRLQASPLAAVISIARGRQLLFVQQHESEPVVRLLDAWGLDKGAAERKAYPHLGPVALEAIADRL